MCQPREQLGDLCQHQTLPCLCCSLGQVFNTGFPSPGISVKHLTRHRTAVCDSKCGPGVEQAPKQDQGTDETDPAAAQGPARLSHSGMNMGEQRRSPKAQQKVFLGSSMACASSHLAWARGSESRSAAPVLRGVRSTPCPQVTSNTPVPAGWAVTDHPPVPVHRLA